MARKRQANLERFAGSIASLVGGEKHKNRAGQRIGKPKFQLDRKKERKLKKELKKEKRLKHILLKGGAELPGPELKNSKENDKSSKKKKKKSDKEAYIAGRNNAVSLQSKLDKIYAAAPQGGMSKEEAEIANKQEDKIIKDLEKRLGFRKNAKKPEKTPNSLNVDGLGYVLDFKDDCDKSDSNKKAAETVADDLFQCLDSEEEMMDDDEDFDDGEDSVNVDDEDFDDIEDFVGDEEFKGDEELDDDEDFEESQDDEIEDLDGSEDMKNEDSDGQELADDDDENVPSEEEESASVPEPKKEAISYVPPHLRNLDSNAILKRKVRGYTNRVSTSNIKQILVDVELLYQEYPRGEINRAILSAVSDSCLISSIMPARLCAEHMLFIGALAAGIGPEFISPLLEDLAEKFTSEMKERHGKILNNIVSMICFLYSLKIVSCILVFDIIRKLLDSFQEADLEVLLYIFKSVGLDIRKDDPMALKNIVQIVSDSGSKIKEKSTRFIWFTETLAAVKNNNVNKIPNYDKSDITEIQKAYKVAVKHAPNNLQVTLSDLLDAKTKGRWWVVGAAWTGLEESQKTKKTEFDSKLLVLAKKYHMNTEVRRNVFCILMSSEDYEHCFEQISKLNITDKQEREIIHVTMLCALKCKTFNPYYSNVIKRFCESSKNFQITTQFSIWDRLKELQSLNDSKMKNFISILCSLFTSKTISLSVLKIVNFVEIGTTEVDFYKELFQKLLNESEILITEMFGRLQPLPLDNLKNGIKVFIKHFLKPELSTGERKNMKIALKCF